MTDSTSSKYVQDISSSKKHSANCFSRLLKTVDKLSRLILKQQFEARNLLFNNKLLQTVVLDTAAGPLHLSGLRLKTREDLVKTSHINTRRNGLPCSLL